MIYFNSQPHKEADNPELLQEESDEYFNSQPHKEADGIRRYLIAVMLISTHSLTRRLTLSKRYRNYQLQYFNSQPHKEADSISFSFLPCIILFQLTASQGG